MHPVSQLPRYICVQCDQRFTRKEHLQRHQIRHGASRQFECKECFHKFTRSDVLRRHERIHQLQQEGRGRSQDENLISTGRKLRASVACDRCAQAKLRCDGRFPCDRCQRKSLVCTLDRPHTTIKRQNTLPGQNSFEQYADDPKNSTYLPSCTDLSPVATSHPAAQVVEASLNNLSALDQTTSFLERDAVINTANQRTPNITGLPIHPMGEQELVGLERISSDTEFLRELSFPFQVPSQYIGEGFQHFPWPTAETLFDGTLEGDQDSLDTQEALTKTPTPAVGVASTINPYANCPFEYRFKRGPTVNANRICEFLHDRSCWQHICVTNKTLSTAEAPISRIVESFRDTISARVYGMLYKLLDRNEFMRIPHLFPPLETIQSLFIAYRAAFLPLYPIAHTSMFSESSWDTNNPYADIGIFLTTAMVLGCLVTPVEEARLFSTELGYLIRLTITEGATQDETRLTDKWVLSAWVMITVFSAWSGIKRHMEMAEAYKGILSAFFLRRGYYRSHYTGKPGSYNKTPISWSSWKNKERDLRLCQVWFMIDHEISLLYSVQPSIGFTKLRCPMPVSDELFLLEKEEDWADLVDKWSNEGWPTTTLHPPSLPEFYRLFLRHDFLHLNLYVTPLQLRLLLCAIQPQVSQYSESYRFIPLEERFSSSSSVSGAGDFMQLRQLEELENMMVKWNILAERVFAAQPGADLKVSCLLISQLMWLELYICFDDVQLIAGKEGYKVGRPYLTQLQQWAQSSYARKAIAHAGNVIWILQASGDDYLRPVWWPVAVSRVALIMWCYIVGLYLSTGNTTGIDDDMLRRAPLISLNDPTTDFNPHGRILQPGEGIPCIQTICKTLIPLHDVPALFDFYIEVLEDSKRPDTPILQSSRQFLLDIKGCGIPYVGDESLQH